MSTKPNKVLRSGRMAETIFNVLTKCDQLPTIRCGELDVPLDCRADKQFAVQVAGTTALGTYYVSSTHYYFLCWADGEEAYYVAVHDGKTHKLIGTMPDSTQFVCWE